MRLFKDWGFTPMAFMAVVLHRGYGGFVITHGGLFAGLGFDSGDFGGYGVDVVAGLTRMVVVESFYVMFLSFRRIIFATAGSILFTSGGFSCCSV
jgi:hypothetical protein